MAEPLRYMGCRQLMLRRMAWRPGASSAAAAHAPRCALWARHLFLFLLLAARRRGERWVGGAAHLTDGARHGPRRNFLLRRRRGGGGVPGKRHGLRSRRSRRGLPAASKRSSRLCASRSFFVELHTWCGGEVGWGRMGDGERGKGGWFTAGACFWNWCGARTR